MLLYTYTKIIFNKYNMANNQNLWVDITEIVEEEYTSKWDKLIQELENRRQEINNILK